MTTEAKNRLLFIVLIVLAVLIGWAIMYVDDAGAEGLYYSWEGTENVVTFETDIECDSAMCFFGYPDLTNLYDTVTLYPISNDSGLLYGTGLRLDSLGVHDVLILFWPQGAAAIACKYDTAFWYHSTVDVYPTLAAPLVGKACAVAVYVRDNAGNFASGVTVTAYVGGTNLADSSGAAITNTVQRGRTDANGRVVFTCMWSSYIVPNTNWRFSCQGSNVGTINKTYTVPRQDTVTLRLN